MTDQTTNTSTDDQLAIAEGIVADLVGVFKSEASAEGKLEKAKEAAEKTREASIHSLADKFATLHNVQLSSEMIEGIAESAAFKIAGANNPKVLKTRKSEIKVLLNNKDQVKPIVDAFDAYRTTRQKDDPKFSFNIRTKALGALRKMQKDAKLTPAKIIAEQKQLDEYEPSAQERALKVVDRMLDMDAIKITNSHGRVITDARAVKALELLTKVIKEGPRLREEDDLEFEGPPERDSGKVDVAASNAELGGAQEAPEAQEPVSATLPSQDELTPPDPASELPAEAMEPEEAGVEPQFDASDLDFDLDDLVKIA